MGEGAGEAGIAGKSSSLYFHVAAGEWAGEDVASVCSRGKGTGAWVRADGGKTVMQVPCVLGLQQQVAVRGPWRPGAHRNAEMSQRMWPVGVWVCVRRPHPHGVFGDPGLG